MMTNYFIANGIILDTGMSPEEIEVALQEKLDETTGGMAQFRLQELSDSCVTMMFIRDLIMGDLYEPIIYDCDMNLILNIGIEAFIPKELGGYPLLFPLGFRDKNFYTDTTSFIRFYKTLLFLYRQQEVESIGVRCYSDRLLLKIEY